MNTTVQIAYDRALVKSYLISWSALILHVMTLVIAGLALWSYMVLKQRLRDMLEDVAE